MRHPRASIACCAACRRRAFRVGTWTCEPLRSAGSAISASFAAHVAIRYGRSSWRGSCHSPRSSAQPRVDRDRLQRVRMSNFTARLKKSRLAIRSRLGFSQAERRDVDGEQAFLRAFIGAGILAYALSVVLSGAELGRTLQLTIVAASHSTGRWNFHDLVVPSTRGTATGDALLRDLRRSHPAYGRTLGCGRVWGPARRLLPVGDRRQRLSLWPPHADVLLLDIDRVLSGAIALRTVLAGTSRDRHRLWLGAGLHSTVRPRTAVAPDRAKGCRARAIQCKKQVRGKREPRASHPADRRVRGLRAAPAH